MEELLSLRWDIMPEAFLKIGSRYFLAAAIAFIIFYVVFKQQFFYKVILVNMLNKLTLTKKSLSSLQMTTCNHLTKTNQIVLDVRWMMTKIMKRDLNGNG